MMINGFSDSSRPDPPGVTNFAQSAVAGGNPAAAAVPAALPDCKSLMFHQKPRGGAHRFSPPSLPYKRYGHGPITANTLFL